LAREGGQGDDAFDGADPAVEGQFAGDDVAPEVGGGVVVGRGGGRGKCESAGGDEKAERDWKVIDGAFLSKVGGREIDEEAAVAGGVAGVGEGGADALEGFFHAGVGQADDELAGVGGGVVEVDLDLAGEGVDAGEEVGLDACEHMGSVEETGRSGEVAEWRSGQVVKWSSGLVG
jgi:hypothetical protein